MEGGRRYGAARMLEIDRIVPAAQGGGDELSNLTLVCREHNHYRAWVIVELETDEWIVHQLPRNGGFSRQDLRVTSRHYLGINGFCGRDGTFCAPLGSMSSSF